MKLLLVFKEQLLAKLGLVLGLELAKIVHRRA
jgi:hypothetical protein